MHMTVKNLRPVPDIEADPFGERSAATGRRELQLMGGRFQFESESPELLRLVDAAYKGLPNHRFSGRPPRFRIRLILAPSGGRRKAGSARAGGRKDAPRIRMLNGVGFLGSATDTSTFAVLSPVDRTAVIFVSRDMLRSPYHVRYELIEFAVFTLASRAQHLVPLHAACVGLNGRGVLLMGPSGAGKSTVALQCLSEGFDFLAEDSVFVEPLSMRATGTANFLHVRADSLRWLGRSPTRSIINRSPVIRRRSGVKKFEVDLRREEFRLAKAPLKIVGVAFLSPQAAGTGPLLRRLPAADTLQRLKQEQAYGAGLPQWRSFSRNLLRLGGFEVRRGAHPSASVEVLRSMLRQEATKSRRSRG
jgi:HPr Serine kinase C-terminal domain